MKKEIEVKFTVDDFTNIQEKFEKLGCTFTEPIVQDDTIFINYDRPFLEFTPDDIFLRIRKAKGLNIFTYKKGEEMNSIEHEVNVADADQLQSILIGLGFRPEVHVRKTRQKCVYKEYEVCLDIVDGLGSFIELEKITDEDALTVQNEMISFLSDLGIDPKNRVMHGYDTLIYLKNNS